MLRNYAIATLALTAAFAAPAAAGMLTMTADSPSGADAWSGYTDYKMVLTITSDDLNNAGSASSFTLQSWNFQAFDSTGTQVFAASGSATTFSAQGTGPTYNAVISLDSGTITKNTLDPIANYVAFSYDFVDASSLEAAITASAAITKGSLMLGTDLDGGGDLSGFYAVPAPSALALIGVGGLMGRRRRN
jgi:hypothetical protein